MDQKMFDQIVKAVVEEIALTNAGFLPADADSLQLVKLKAEAEKAKAEMAEAKLNEQRAQIELEKAQETVANLKLANQKLQLEADYLRRQQLLSDTKAQLEVEKLQQENVLRQQEIENYRMWVPAGTMEKAVMNNFNRMRKKMMSDYGSPAHDAHQSGFGSFVDGIFN